MKCEWEKYEIGDLCSSISETYKGKHQYVVTINTSDVLAGEILNHSPIKNDGLKGQFKKTFQKGDILYSEIRPANRRFAFVNFQDTGNYIASTKLMVLRANENIVLPEYLFAFLKSPAVISELQMLAETRSGTFPQITFSGELAKLEITLPDIQIQKKIVDILQVLEDKIAINGKILVNFQQQAQAIFKSWFVDFEPFDGVQPECWEEVPFGQLVDIGKKSFNPAKEPETLLEHYSIPAFDETKYPVFELSTNIKSNKFLVDKDCFLISKLNPTTKRVWRPYCLSNHAVCSTEFIVYRAKNRAYTDFLYSVVDSEPFSAFMCSHVTGSTGSRQRTTPSETLNFPLVLPTPEVIERFAEIVNPMYARMKECMVENQKLKQLRDGLLPKLMSGDIPV